MSDKLRFGICGLGFMGRTYFAHLKSHPHAEIVAVCDRAESVRRGAVASGGNIGGAADAHLDLADVALHTEPAALLADDNVDVVAVTLPTPLHAPVTAAALRHGRHVICEKPMAATLDACDAMIAAAEDARRTLMIGQCIRFWPQYETIVDLVRAGRLGEVRFAKLTRIASAPTYSSDNWLMDGALSGGALLDLHVHDVDFAQTLLGIPEEISAVGSVGRSGAIDHVIATYRHQTGAHALLEGAWSYHAPWPFEMALTVIGTTATATWSSRGDSDVLCYAGGDAPERLPCAAETGWGRQLDYFIECVRDGRPVTRCTPQSSRLSVALALLEKRAIDEQRPVIPGRTSP